MLTEQAQHIYCTSVWIDSVIVSRSVEAFRESQSSRALVIVVEHVVRN